MDYSPLKSTTTDLKRYNYDRLLDLVLCVHPYAEFEENIQYGKRGQKERNIMSVEEVIRKIDSKLAGFKEKHNVTVLGIGKSTMMQSAWNINLQAQNGNTVKKMQSEVTFRTSKMSFRLRERLQELTRDVPDELLQRFGMTPTPEKLESVEEVDIDGLKLRIISEY